MIKSFSTLILILLVQNLVAQEFYLSTGKNYTTYYSAKSDNSLLNKSNKIASSGTFYEAGMVFNKKKPVVAYSVGLNFNEYTTSYVIPGTAIRYDWQTSYLGIQNSIVYNVLHATSKDLKINTSLGVTTSLYVNGYQNANGIHYKVTNNAEYDKVIVQPFGGVQLAYPVSDRCKFNAGYQWSIATIGKDAGNNFNYINQKVQFGLSFLIQ